MDVRTPVKPSLTVKRRFKASPAKVFAAWTDPEKVKHWMGPGQVRVVEAQADARPGGRYRWHMQSPEGKDHEQFSSDEARDGHRQGWDAALEKFEKFIDA